MEQTYPLIKSNVMITDPKEKANALAEYFTNNSRMGIHWTPGDAENMIESAKLFREMRNITRELVSLNWGSIGKF